MVRKPSRASLRDHTRNRAVIVWRNLSVDFPYASDRRIMIFVNGFDKGCGKDKIIEETKKLVEIKVIRLSSTPQPRSIRRGSARSKKLARARKRKIDRLFLFSARAYTHALFSRAERLSPPLSSLLTKAIYRLHLASRTKRRLNEIELIRGCRYSTTIDIEIDRRR